MVWFGVSILSAIASILSFLLYVGERIGVWPVLVMLLVTVVALVLALRSVVLRSPVFCTSTRIRLQFDARGAVVPVEKVQEFVALRRHITRFDELVASTSPITDLSASIDGVPSAVRIVEQTGGDTCFAHEFSRQLRPLKRYTRRVSYTLRDCFPAKDEWYEVDGLYPGLVLVIELDYPRERAPITLTGLKKVGAITMHEQDILAARGSSEHRVSASAKFRWVTVGSKYRVEWAW